MDSERELKRVQETIMHVHTTIYKTYGHVFTAVDTLQLFAELFAVDSVGLFDVVSVCTG